MFTRTITIAGNPDKEITLYFNDRVAAEKTGTRIFPDDPQSKILYSDDYGTIFIRDMKAGIIGDVIANPADVLRALGEMQVVKMLAEMQFGERVKNDPDLQPYLQAKMAAQKQ